MTMNKAALNDSELDTVSGGTILPYQVQPGDTMQAIADKYHVTVDQLARWNNIQNPGMLMAGQKLQIKF